MITVKVPDSWAEVTLGQFIEIAQLDSKDKDIQLVSILIDKDPEEIRKYNPQSFSRIKDAISWVQTLPEENFQSTLKIGDKEFEFLHRLSLLSNGEWIDLEMLIPEYAQNIHKIMAILYRPAGDLKYDTVSAAHRAELFKEKMSYTDAYSALVFFSLIAKSCMITIQDYLKKQIPKTSGESQNKNESKESKKKKPKALGMLSGNGINFFTSWRKGISQRLVR